MSALSLRYRAHSVLDDLRFLAAIVAATFAFPGSASGQSYFDVVHTVLRTSTGEGGYSSGGGLLLATDGNLYGTTWYGGVGQFGTVFRMTPSGALRCRLKLTVPCFSDLYYVAGAWSGFAN